MSESRGAWDSIALLGLKLTLGWPIISEMEPTNLVPETLLSLLVFLIFRSM